MWVVRVDREKGEREKGGVWRWRRTDPTPYCEDGRREWRSWSISKIMMAL
jgi:hypothetical protein